MWPSTRTSAGDPRASTRTRRTLPAGMAELDGPTRASRPDSRQRRIRLCSGRAATTGRRADSHPHVPKFSTDFLSSCSAPVPPTKAFDAGRPMCWPGAEKPKGRPHQQTIGPRIPRSTEKHRARRRLRSVNRQPWVSICEPRSAQQPERPPPAGNTLFAAVSRIPTSAF